MESNKERRRIRRTEINDDTILRLYLEDRMSIYGISKLLGYNYMTIRSRLVRAGVLIPGGHKIGAFSKEVNQISIKAQDIESVTIYNNGIYFNLVSGERKGYRVTNNKITPIIENKEEGDSEQ